ncbi:MAG: HNH endonuclease [Parcubacteria group bacterium Gr01-1014_48]|nr:MAG: HNH endonuclease [Parcubacteria group bacterium Greene0416_14]TSC73857.1 MAG: HNH endonuclease [Parcubacteria group bacterium Gr01-1014_48]TSD00410.1 MAG: HNH endonuclease [Parcubacteria group bacterium Greene1014_15]TSD07525.1 MAG: HNH endonuclease [Parcubacteria group bacterium Greene0714_4]
MTEHYIRNPNTKCIVCSTPVYRRPVEIQKNRGNVFCRQACYGVFQRKEKPCVICGLPILASAHKKTCSRGCANKNRAEIKYHVSSPRDKVKSQQALKVRLLNARGKHCERCNYSKYEILHVHHKDRNRDNNNLTNLELICPNCHHEEHYLEKSWLKNVSIKSYGGVG